MIQWGLPQNSSTTLMIIPNSDSGCAAYIAFHNISWLPFAFFRQASCQEKQLRWIHRCIYYPPCPPPSSQSLVLRTSKSDFVKLCDLPNPTTYNLSKPEKNVKTCGRHWETAHLPSPFHQISCVKASCQIAHFQEMALVGSGAQLPKGRRRTNLRYFVSQFSWRKEGIWRHLISSNLGVWILLASHIISTQRDPKCVLFFRCIS